MNKSHVLLYMVLICILVVASCSAPGARAKRKSLLKENSEPLIDREGITLTGDAHLQQAGNKNNGGAPTTENGEDANKPSIPAGTTLEFSRTTVTKLRRDNTYTYTPTQTKVAGDTGEISYTSSDSAIATVDDAGTVTFIHPLGGKVIITATKAATPQKYMKSIATYNLIIEHPGNTISYESKVVQAVFRYPFTYTQELTKTRDVADDVGEITYASSDPAIATVDTAGVVTMKKVNEEGDTTVTITATKAATPARQYLKSSDSYTLTITRFKPVDKAALVREIQEITKPAAQGMRADLNYIDTSAIEDMSELFSDDKFSAYGLGAFNGDISKWDVSMVTDMSRMFEDSMFNGVLSEWRVGQVTDMSDMFNDSMFENDISTWDVSGVTNMSDIFHGAMRFNNDLSGWDVRNVTDMTRMFASAPKFRGTKLGCWADRIHADVKANEWKKAFRMFMFRGSRISIPAWYKKTTDRTPPADCTINPKDSERE